MLVKVEYGELSKAERHALLARGAAVWLVAPLGCIEAGCTHR
jgi:hypothetical protein